MIKIALTLRFKGRRDYLHGTDFYNALCDHLPEALQSPPRPPFRMIIHKFARNQCDLLVSDGSSITGRPEGHVAELACTSEAGKVVGWLVETDRPVEGRYAYDEELIESSSVIEGDTIAFAGESGYTPIEVAVALARYLHYTLYPTNDKWIFTRLDLTRFFRAEDARFMRIRVEHNFNNKITKSVIEAHDEVVGRIYFSTVKP